MEHAGRTVQPPKKIVRRKKPSASPFLSSQFHEKRTIAAATDPPKPRTFAGQNTSSIEEIAILTQGQVPKKKVAFIGLVEGSETKEGEEGISAYALSSRTLRERQTRVFEQELSSRTVNQREQGVFAQIHALTFSEYWEMKEEKRRTLEERKAIKAKPLKTPQDMIRLQILKPRNKPEYRRKLRELLQGENTRFLSRKEVDILDQSQSTVPRFLYRTYSLKNGVRRETPYYSTNGSNREDRFLPAADSNEGHACQRSITHLPIGVGQYMLGMHLRWQDQRWDEFLFWTNTLLFAIEHALGRMHRGEKDIWIAMVDIRETRDMHSWPGWGDLMSHDLYPRKFTHEYLSHGTVFVHDQGVRRVSLLHLIEHGLFEVFPEFQVPPDFETSGLYTRLVALRHAWFPPIDENPWKEKYINFYSYEVATKAEPITERIIEICNKLTVGFAVQQPDPAVPCTVAPLHAFLTILSMRKRRIGEFVLIDWLRDHYTTEELIDGFHNGFTHVPVSLPERIQYVDLIRHACVAFNVRMIPQTILQIEDPVTGERYEKHDFELQRDAQLYSKLSLQKIKAWATKAETAGKFDLARELRARARVREPVEREELKDLKDLRRAEKKARKERWSAFKPVSTKRSRTKPVESVLASVTPADVKMADAAQEEPGDDELEIDEEMDTLIADVESGTDEDLPLFVQDDG